MNKPSLSTRISLIAMMVVAVVAALALAGRGLSEAAENAAGVTVQPSAAAQKGAPGAVVVYTARVTNTGSTGDVFALSVSGNNWPTSISVNGTGTGLLPLPPGAGQNVEIQVTIPMTAGGSDVAVFEARSNSDTNVFGTAVLTTTVERKYYFPVIYTQ